MAYRFDELEQPAVAIDADAEMLALIRRATAAPAASPARKVGGVARPKQGWQMLRQVNGGASMSDTAPKRWNRIVRFWPAIGALALVITFPLHVLALASVFMVVLCGLIVWALGYSRISRMVVAQYRAIQASDPQRAEVVRQRAIRISHWIEGWLQRLPETWTRGLYLPDFDPEDAPEQFSTDPFERLHQFARSR